MLTYVDLFTRLMADNLRRDPDLKGPLGKDLSKMSDFRVMELYHKALRMMNNVSMKRSYEELKSDTHHLVFDMSRVMAPFYIPDLMNVLSLQLTPELIEDFHGTNAPEGTQDHMDVINSYGMIYIDIPLGAYNMFGTTDLRAIFLSGGVTSASNPDLPPMTRIHLVMTKPTIHRIDEQFIAEYFLENPDLDAEGNISMDTTQMVRHMMNLLGGSGGEEFQSWHEEMHDLIKLTLLYYKSETERPNPRLTFDPLPKIDPKDLDKTHRLDKQRNKMRDHTLFSILKLTPPSDRFGRENQEHSPKGGWTLGVRTPVRGHFKYAACGTKFSEHRLTYVEPYVKNPKGEPGKNPMYQMKPE